MASPSVRSSINTDGGTATATPVVSLPATVRAGDTLWVVFRSAVAGAVGWPAGWNELTDESTDADDDQQSCAWKKADGSESGTTITLSAGNGKFAAGAWAIQDAADPTLRAPELSTVATGSTPTQANATTVTPTGGSKDYLFLTFVGVGGEPTVPPTYPTNYTLGQVSATSGTAAATTTNCCVAGAARQATASSEDAGAWSYAGTFASWTAYTAAFHPAVAVTTPLQTEYPQPNPQVKTPAVVTMLSIGLGLLQSTLFVPPVPFYQTEWPKPLGKAALEITTETRPAEDGAEAFSQQDWPNPQGKPFNLLGRTWTINLQESTLAPAATPAPFALTAWPNPVGRRAWPVGTNAYAPGPGPQPFNQNEWASPRSPSAVVDLRTWRTPGIQAAAVAAPFVPVEWTLPKTAPPPNRGFTDQSQRNRDTFFGAPGQVPDYDWPNPVRPRPAQVDLYNLEQALPIQLLVPFLQTEWPNPLKARPAVDLANVEQPLPIQLLVSAPFGQVDWPLPRLARVHPSAWTLELQQSTLPTVAAAPFWLSDWPIVRPVVQAIDLRTHVLNLQQGTLGTIVPPFVPGDWPNPRGKDFPIVLRTGTDGRKAYHVDLTPAHLTEWPNPRGLTPSLELRTAVANLLEYTLGQGTPFSLSEWPLPIGKVFPVALRTSLEWRDLVLVDPLPTGRQTDWPNPRDGGRIIDLRTWTGNLQESTLAIVVSYPFGLTDWPLAPGKSFPSGLRTHVAWRALSLVDPLPTGRLQDWPTPRGKKAAEDLRTWWQNLQQTTLAAVPPPIALFDWPIPTGRSTPITQRTIAQWRPLGILETVPVHLTDWPNPQGKPYPVTLRTWSKGEWLTIAGLVVQIPATGDYLVLIPADDTVVRMPADDHAILLPADDRRVVMPLDDFVILIPPDDEDVIV